MNRTFEIPDKEYLSRSRTEQERILVHQLIADPWNPYFALDHAMNVGKYVKHPTPKHVCGTVLKQAWKVSDGYVCVLCGTQGWLVQINRDEYLTKNAAERQKRALEALAEYEAHGATVRTAALLAEALKEAML